MDNTEKCGIGRFGADVFTLPIAELRTARKKSTAEHRSELGISHADGQAACKAAQLEEEGARCNPTLRGARPSLTGRA